MMKSPTTRCALLLVLGTLTAFTGSSRAQEFAPLRTFMEDSVKDGVVVGCAAQVTQGGETIFLDAVGNIDPEGTRPLRTDDVVRIYSMTKAITTTAAMMLLEEGRLGLDDPVSRYIPEFADVRVADWPEGVERIPDTMQLVAPDRPVSVRDLILHTSGLGYSFSVEPALKPAYLGHWDGQTTLEGAIAHVSTIPLARQPGTEFIYGLNSDVLGRVIEVASGQSFDAFLEERLFQPLGMVDTGFSAGPPERSMPLTRKRMRDGVLVRDSAGIPGNNTSQLEAIPLGGQGLFSTLADYTRFCQMILQKGSLDGRQYLTPETVAFMSHNHLGPHIKSNGMRFGMGFAVERPVPTPRGWRGGGRLAWSGAASTFFFIDPAQNLTAVYVTQLMPWNGGLGQRFNVAVLESIAERETPPAERETPPTER